MRQISVFCLCLGAALLLGCGAVRPVFADSGSGFDKAELEEMKSLYVRSMEIPYPEDNPYTPEKNELGRLLFFDPRISASGTQSCATCHNPAFHWEDGMARATGNGHLKLERASPTILNLAWDELFFWDGRSEGLEAQALEPIQSENEMAMPLEAMIARLDGLSGYRQLFEKAFPEQVAKGENVLTAENVARALATFERGIVSGQAPFDEWIEGDESAISEAAKRGFILFNKKANCAACHTGWNFSDGSFHDIGLKSDDIGRGKFLTKIPAMRHAFKTVGLRNIVERAPYMHDGSIASLEGVIDHYNDGFVKRESLSSEIKPLHLSEEEKADLIEFMKSLSSRDKPVEIPILPK